MMSAIKNGQYLGKDYFKELLEHTVAAFFDYIEGIIERRASFPVSAEALKLEQQVDASQRPVEHSAASGVELGVELGVESEKQPRT